MKAKQIVEWNKKADDNIAKVRAAWNKKGAKLTSEELDAVADSGTAPSGHYDTNKYWSKPSRRKRVNTPKGKRPVEEEMEIEAVRAIGHLKEFGKGKREETSGKPELPTLRERIVARSAEITAKHGHSLDIRGSDMVAIKPHGKPELPQSFAHHEYGMDVRNLTQGQLTESYVELKAHAEALAEALRDCLKCHSDNAPIHAVITRALAAWEDAAS